MNWDSKTTWRGLMALLLALSVAWIALRRVPAEAGSARSDRALSSQTDFAAPDFTLETLDGLEKNTPTLSAYAVRPSRHQARKHIFQEATLNPIDALRFE